MKMFPLFKLPGVLHWVNVNIDSAASASSGSVRERKFTFSLMIKITMISMLIFIMLITNSPLPTFLVIGMRTRLAVVRMFF